MLAYYWPKGAGLEEEEADFAAGAGWWMGRMARKTVRIKRWAKWRALTINRALGRSTVVTNGADASDARSPAGLGATKSRAGNFRPAPDGANRSSPKSRRPPQRAHLNGALRQT